jgi:hypothetical protein
VQLVSLVYLQVKEVLVQPELALLARPALLVVKVLLAKLAQLDLKVFQELQVQWAAQVLQVQQDQKVL